MPNNGVIINGGTVNVDQWAVGTNARINNRYGAAEQRQLVHQLGVLPAEIRAARLPAERREQLTKVVDDLGVEAERAAPDKSKFERGLDFVERAASSLGGVMSAVKIAKDVAGLFL